MFRQQGVSGAAEACLECLDRPRSGLLESSCIQSRAEVAEWQTRMVQDHVPARAWGFNSPLRHHITIRASRDDLEALLLFLPERCRWEGEVEW